MTIQEAIDTYHLEGYQLFFYEDCPCANEDYEVESRFFQKPIGFSRNIVNSVWLFPDDKIAKVYVNTESVYSFDKYHRQVDSVAYSIGGE